MNTPFPRSRCRARATLALLLPLLCLPRLAQAFDWKVSVIEPGKRFDNMGSRSLVLDSNGRPQIAYGGRDLYNAWYDGAKWHTMIVDTGPGIGGHAAIALPPDSSSTCIGYIDEPNAHVKCAQWVSAGFFPFFLWYWRIETVANAATNRSVTVAADFLGQPRLLFFSPSGHLRYAYRENNQWYFETVYLNTANDAQNYADMMSDSAGRIHVVFCRNNQPLTYARRELNGTWTQSNFGLTEDGDAYPALALDSADRPHVVYARNSPPSPPSYLVYTHFDGATWPEEAIGASENYVVARNLSAAMRNGRLHISYFDPDYKNLVCVDVTAGTSTTVDYGTNTGDHSSIAVTASGEPRISYYNSDREELKFASFGAPSWSLEVLDQARSGPEGLSLASDSSGVMHATWVDSVQQHLRYARQSETGWEVTAVADGASSHTSLKLTSNGYPRVAYYSGVSNALRYAAYLRGDQSGSWQKETIDTGGGYSSSLAMTADDWPWISYKADGHIKCAYQNTNGWHLLTVDNSGGMDVGTSLAFAPNGTPSIAYGRLGVLIYAYSHWYRGLLFWDQEIVATNYDFVIQPTLVFNSDGQPCIGFVEDVQGPRFAWRDGTGWHAQNLDPLQWSSSCSYAMDGAGLHYLVYQSGKEDCLKHAFGYGALTNLTWRVQKIQLSQVHQEISLVVRDSMPHVAYSGRYADRDALYARGLPLRLTKITHTTEGADLQWSGETNGVEVQSRAKVNTGRWSAVAHGLSGTNLSLAITNPAVFYRLRLE